MHTIAIRAFTNVRGAAGGSAGFEIAQGLTSGIRVESASVADIELNYGGEEKRTSAQRFCLAAAHSNFSPNAEK